MKATICDICGQKIGRHISHKLIIKKRWHLFYQEGWYKLDVCDLCADSIIEEVKRRRINETIDIC